MLAIAVAVVTIAVALALTSGRRGPRHGGPLASNEQITWCIPVMDTGDVTWGSNALQNQTRSPLTLMSVEPGPVSGGVDVAEMLIAPIEDRTLIGLVHGWVPVPDGRPARGRTVAAGETVNVIARIRADPRSGGHVDGLEVTYEHDDRTYRDVVSSSLRVAARGETC